MRALFLLTALSSFLMLPATAGAERWRWPVRGPVLERFDYGPDPFARGQHRGIDIGAPVGTPVRSACGGRVSFAGRAATAGATVSVRCGRLTASYLHLGSIAVRRGVRVDAGEELGTVGRSGRPRLGAPHVHLGVRVTGRRFAYLDPLTLLSEPDRPGPAPVPAPAPAPMLPVAARRPVWRPAAQPHGATVPVPAWIGLGLLAVAVPGLSVSRARRRRRTRAAGRTETALRTG